jgi:hypothetical protein
MWHLSRKIRVTLTRLAAKFITLFDHFDRDTMDYYDLREKCPYLAGYLQASRVTFTLTYCAHR